jgi:hypothetical protein
MNIRISRFRLGNEGMWIPFAAFKKRLKPVFTPIQGTGGIVA